MDVTAQILKQIREQGGSDNTNPAVLGAGKVLNYAAGPSIQRPEELTVTSIPLVVPFEDSIGLGASNYYIKFKLDHIQARFACYEPAGWECARIEIEKYPEASDYAEAVMDETKDRETLNTYEPATLENSGIKAADHPRLSIRLQNRGTGNIYEDKDFDPFIIKKNHDPISVDKLWCKLNDVFYVGFHVRNTKRIPYKCDVLIGEEVIVKRDITEGVLNEI